MGQRGPTPKPSHLKVLEGNPGKRPLNQNEPKPKKKAPTCPKHLDPIAKKEWKRIAPELERLGLLTVVDGATLEMCCTAYSRWMMAEEAIMKHLVEKKSLTFITPSGYPQQIPEIGIANQAMKLYKQLAAEFGLTPASRSRINLPKPPQENPLMKFLERNANRG
jgi:P27 family predicted phage terminase small subunit